jgi:predicted glutamine amidotransferase
MCRLLGIVPERSVRLVTYLPPGLTPPRESVAGWGAAVHEPDGSWTSIEAEGRENDRPFYLVDRAPRGDLLIAAARRRTKSGVEAQPIRSGRWVFAQDGVIEDSAFLRSRTSAERLRACKREGGCEELFAFLLSRLDAGASPSRDLVDSVIMAAIAELSARPLGALTFLLSDGDAIYGYRFGRPLHLSSRRASDGVAAATLLASEPINKDLWTALDDGTLVRCRRGAQPRILAGPHARVSDVELPFTD